MWLLCPAGTIYLQPDRRPHGFYCYTLIDLLGPDLFKAFVEEREEGGLRYKLSARLFVDLGKAMLKALRYVHEHGIVHR
jgi:hypothetical protein